MGSTNLSFYTLVNHKSSIIEPNAVLFVPYFIVEMCDMAHIIWVTYDYE